MCGVIGAMRGIMTSRRVPLDVEFLRITHAAMGHHRGLAGMESGLAGEILGGVGFDGAIHVAIVEARRLHHHEIGGLQRHPALRQRMGDGLVLADRPAEHHALARVAGGLSQGGAADADRLGGDQDALRIHAVQDGAEALSPSSPMRSAAGTTMPSKNISFESTA